MKIKVDLNWLGQKYLLMAKIIETIWNISVAYFSITSLKKLAGDKYYREIGFKSIFYRSRKSKKSLNWAYSWAHFFQIDKVRQIVMSKNDYTKCIRQMKDFC